MVNQWVIDQVVVPLFERAISKKTGQSFSYDLDLAQNAKFHSMYMRGKGYVINSAPGWKGRAKEEVVCSAKFSGAIHDIVDERGIENVFEKIIGQIYSNPNQRVKFAYDTVGIGIVYNKSIKRFYITLRFLDKPKEQFLMRNSA